MFLRGDGAGAILCRKRRTSQNRRHSRPAFSPCDSDSACDLIRFPGGCLIRHPKGRDNGCGAGRDAGFRSLTSCILITCTLWHSPGAKRGDNNSCGGENTGADSIMIRFLIRSSLIHPRTARETKLPLAVTRKAANCGSILDHSPRVPFGRLRTKLYNCANSAPSAPLSDLAIQIAFGGQTVA